MRTTTSASLTSCEHRYGRIGHLFQERFKSQPVNDWYYFVTLLRYIHQNPTKGHIVEDVEDYPWSSWLEYTGKADAAFCSTGTVLKRMPFTDLLQLVNLLGHPRTLSRLTGVPYSIVQRATSGKAANDNDISSCVSEPDPWDALYETFLDDGELEQYPEY